jgi:hypothetical protein
MTGRPIMDQAPEYADLLALLRAHLAGDEYTVQLLLVDSRLDTFAMVALLAGHAVQLAERVFGSLAAYDRWLAEEQRALGRR